MISPLQLAGAYLLVSDFRFDLEATPEPSECPLVLAVRGREQARFTADAEVTPDVLPLALDLATVIEFDKASSAEKGESIAFSLRLTLRLNPQELQPHTALRAEAEWIGRFFAGGLPDEADKRDEVLRIVRANAAAMLYGMARSHVLTLTHLVPGGAVLLPSISFKEVIEAEEALEAA